MLILFICFVVVSLAPTLGKSVYGLYHASQEGFILSSVRAKVESWPIPYWMYDISFGCPYCMPTFWIGILALLPLNIFILMKDPWMLPVGILTYIYTISAASTAAGEAKDNAEKARLEIIELTDIEE